MLIAEYDSSDAYITKDEDGKELIQDECYFDEIIDQWNGDTFREDVEEAFYKRKFPLVLMVTPVNWRGQTGYAKVDNIQEVLNKLFSFDSSYYKLHRTAGSALHFTFGTHDMPTGVTMYIKPYNKAYWTQI